MPNNIRKESTKNKFLMNKEKINFIPYWDFLKLIPSYKGSKEALLLAFLIDEDGKDYNRHPETPSWFKCSRGMMCEAVNVSLTAIDRYLDNLQFWGFIKYEAIQLPKEPLCTYVELQGDLIEKLAIYYNKLMEEKKYDEITSISSCNRYIYHDVIDTYITMIQTSILSCDNSNNNTNNSTNNGSNRETPSSDVVLENNKKDIYKGKNECSHFDYKSLKNFPKSWYTALEEQGKSEKEILHALNSLDKFLVQNPDQRYWYTRDLKSFLEGIERALRVVDVDQERDVRLA